MKKLTTLLAFAALLAGCGESFEGNFRSLEDTPAQVNVREGRCAASDNYDLEILATVSGNDIDIQVINLTSTRSSDDRTSSTLNQIFGLIPYGAKVKSNNQTFQAYDSTFNDKDADFVTYNVTGTMNKSRDEITGLDIMHTINYEDGSQCQVELYAPKLVLQK